MSEPDAQPAPAAYAFNQHFTALQVDARTFPQHYLLYASSGTIRLEVEDTTWLLPPQRAAWIAAETPISVRIDAPATCSSVLFAKHSIPALDFPCRVFAISELAREMLLHAMRWGAARAPEDSDADCFFLALAHVCRELAATPAQTWLPRLRSAELRQAAEFTLAHLDAPLVAADAARAASIAERTLARRFVDEAAMTWGQFLRRARMIRAMELLADRRMQVIEVGYATGFASVSAFNTAFRGFTGETPSQYRRRFR